MIDFKVVDPRVEEASRPGESAKEMAARLSAQKADAVARDMPGCIVIAGDQVLEANGKDYGKPGDIETARRHLRELSGKSGTFHSGMSVRHGESRHDVVVPTDVTWAKLDDRQIQSYLEKEPSLASAGAAQLEGLGISLAERISSDDPSAILGVPLISLCRILRGLGVQIP